MSFLSDNPIKSDVKYKFGLVIIFVLLFSIIQTNQALPTAQLGQTKQSTQSTPIAIQSVGSNGYIIPFNFVVDYFYYQIKGSETIPYLTHQLDIINDFYFNSSIPVHFQLQNIEIFDNEVQNNATFTYVDYGFGYDSQQLLPSFASYIASNSSYGKDDFSQLISGVDFDNSTIGLAYLGSNINTPMTSIVQYTYNMSMFEALISTHEMGHNLGAGHDTYDPSNSFCTNVYIMYPCISQANPPSYFSSNSTTEIETYLNTGSSGRFDKYIDNTIPTLNDIVDFDATKIIGATALLNWTFSDDHLFYLDLWLDGVQQIFRDPIGYTNFSYQYSLSTVFVYNVTLVIYDIVGHIARDVVIINVVGDRNPSISDVPDNQMYANDTTPLEWKIADDGNTSHIDVYVNGSVEMSLNFTSVYILDFNITGFAPGIYNITVDVYDELNQHSTTTTFITVLSVPNDTTSTSDTPTNTTSSTPPPTTSESFSTTATESNSTNPLNLSALNLPISPVWVGFGLVVFAIATRSVRKNSKY